MNKEISVARKKKKKKIMLRLFGKHVYAYQVFLFLYMSKCHITIKHSLCKPFIPISYIIHSFISAKDQVAAKERRLIKEVLSSEESD